MGLKKIAISQSNYIPWKGYFDSINLVDEFILYDDMQYTKRDWRNRNKIKVSSGVSWLSIPVQVKGKYNQKINETIISDSKWNINHLSKIKNAYTKANCYEEVIDFIEDLYKTADYQRLTDINHHFISKICSFLNINTKIRLSSEFELLQEGKTEKLVDLCCQLKAGSYFTGTAAKNYIDESLFTDKNIKVCYFDYSNYPEYNQLHGEFEHSVSIIDLIFNEGKLAPSFMKLSS